MIFDFQTYDDSVRSFAQNIYKDFINHEVTLKELAELTSTGDHNVKEDLFDAIIDLRKSVEEKLSSVLIKHVMEMRARVSKVYLEALVMAGTMQAHYRYTDLGMTKAIKKWQMWRKPVSNAAVHLCNTSIDRIYIYVSE